MWVRKANEGQVLPMNRGFFNQEGVADMYTNQRRRAKVKAVGLGVAGTLALGTFAL